MGKKFDAKSFIEKEKEKIEEQYAKSIAFAKRKQKELESSTEYYKKEIEPNFPKDTGAKGKLESSSGAMVDAEMEYSNGRTVTHSNEKFKYNGMIEVGGFGCPVFCEPGDSLRIRKITNTATGEVIFDNPYTHEPRFLQGAKVFGSEAAKKSLESEAKRVEYLYEHAEEEKVESYKALSEIPEYIEAGKKYIFPEKLGEWEECVCYRFSDLYHGMDLKNALTVMSALDEGKSLEEVGKVIDDGHSGMSYGMLCSIVLTFSKRGPEFYRGFSETYKHATPEEKAKIDAKLAKIEEENAKLGANKQQGEE